MAKDQAQPEFVTLRRIFLSQCVDHTLSLAFGIILLFIALSLVQSPSLETMANAGAPFWIGFCAALFFSGLLHRSFCLMIFGVTFGNLCFQVRPNRNLNERQFWMAQAFESLQVIVPALWMLDLISRNRRSKFSGIQYTFDF